MRCGSKKDSKNLLQAHIVSHFRGILKRPFKEDNRHG